MSRTLFTFLTLHINLLPWKLYIPLSTSLFFCALCPRICYFLTPKPETLPSFTTPPIPSWKLNFNLPLRLCSSTTSFVKNSLSILVQVIFSSSVWAQHVYIPMLAQYIQMSYLCICQLPQQDWTPKSKEKAFHLWILSPNVMSAMGRLCNKYLL